MNAKKLGTLGEMVAQKYLKNKGYNIIETNFFSRRGEIDIIAEKDQIIIFIEVKTRRNNKYGTPGMAVTYKKKQHIKITARIYLMLHNLNEREVRFDVIEVFAKGNDWKINHIKGII